MENIKNKMVETLNEVVSGNEKSIGDILEEYGFDHNRDYSNVQMFFIDYAIKHCHGLKNKVKAAVALFVVDNLVNCIIDERPSDEELGKLCYDILEDCKIIKLALPEED